MVWASALVEATALGRVEDQAVLQHAVETLVALTNGSAFGDAYGERWLDRTIPRVVDGEFFSCPVPLISPSRVPAKYPGGEAGRWLE